MRNVFANVISAAASIGFTVFAVAASAPATAAIGDQAPLVIVQTSDLDLASTQGHRAALRRIDAAAQRVCDVTPGDRLGAASCRALAVAAATQALDRMSAPERIAAR